jgi:hypothetical protein
LGSENRGFDSIQIPIASFIVMCSSGTVGDVKIAEAPIAYKSTIFVREACWVTTYAKI